MPLHDVGVEAAVQPGQLGDIRQADADRLAVPPGVTLDLLDRVTEGVPVMRISRSDASRRSA